MLYFYYDYFGFMVVIIFLDGQLEDGVVYYFYGGVRFFFYRYSMFFGIVLWVRRVIRVRVFVILESDFWICILVGGLVLI